MARHAAEGPQASRLIDRRRCWALLALGLSYGSFGADLIDFTSSGQLRPAWLPSEVAGLSLEACGIIWAVIAALLLAMWWWHTADPYLFGLAAASAGAWTVSVFTAWVRGTSGAQLGPLAAYAGITLLILVCAIWPDP